MNHGILNKDGTGYSYGNEYGAIISEESYPLKKKGSGLKRTKRMNESDWELCYLSADEQFDP